MALIQDLQGASRLLDWDRETLMPERGAEARGRIVATLQTLRHRELLRDGVSDDIALLEEHGDLTVAERAMVRLARRAHDRAERVPEGLVRATSEATSQAVAAWLSARADADFAAFAPALERVVDLTRQTGEAIGIGAEPYDALLDTFEPHTTTAQIEELFAELRRELSTIVDGIDTRDGHGSEPFTHRTWPATTQLAVAEDIARMMGFDLEAGVIAQSAHPFTGSPHAGDVRFTTRLTENDPTGNVLVTLHELGHALYAQGLPEAFDRTLLFGSPSLGADESQSRFFENHIGRRGSFWELVHPLFVTRFGAAMDGLTPDGFHRAVTRVERGWCRVDADEVTYDLHIILRFELELALIRGDLRVADLPGAWAERMQRLLGVTPADDAQGCLQDIHWAWGMFGYFPTYTLGNIYAAQLAETLEREEGPLDDLVRAGALDVVLAFMRDRVHRHGDTYPTGELMQRATGQPFSTDAFIGRMRSLASG
jgi:carboxypeptidase Taq